MSNPSETPTNSSVKKQVRRFAPTLRGRGRGTADRSRSATPSTVETPEPSTATESGTQIGHIHSEPSEGRLPSVHGSKTRGGAAKMKFKPTVPSKRNKKEVSVEEAPKTEESNRDSFRGQHGGRGDGRGRGRGRGRGGRGRGRGRGVVVEEVTASGIFSLGPSAMSSRARTGMASGGAYATYGGDTSRTEADNGTETDMSVLFADRNDGYTPVVFPHVPRLAGDLDPADLTNPKEKIPWLTTTTKPEDDKPKDDTKLEDDEELAKVKREPSDEMAIDSTEDQPKEDSKQVDTTTQQVKWMMDGDAPAQNIFAVNEKNKVVSVADDELLFFQLPTVVPLFKDPTEEDDEMKEVKDEDGKGKGKELPLPAQKATLEDKMGGLDLADMPEGQIGKLVVLKSGKMKLKFGDILLDVEQGMQSSFLENIMSVDTTKKRAVELGHIVQKFTCVPNMNALLEGEEEK